MRQTLVHCSLFALGLIGCGGDMHDMTGQLASADQHLGQLQAELDLHARNIAGAQDMPAVLAEETRHAPFAMGHSSDMMGMMSSMMHMCAGSSATAGMQGMSDQMQAMHDDCAAHQATMASAADLATARAQEAEHAGRMHDMMTRMGTLMSGLHGAGAHCMGHM